jgi:hypothetical protein
MTPVNRRDEQIAEINGRTDGLSQERLVECRTAIVEGYKGSSIIDLLARVVELDDRQPSDFSVLTTSEPRAVDHFNDNSYIWDIYCKELGRSVASAEQLHIFDELGRIPSTGLPMDAYKPELGRVLQGVEELRKRGFNPTILIAPVSLHGAMFRELEIDMQTGSDLVLKDASNLHILWSNRVTPIDRFVVLDRESGDWSVKVDPQTKSRLTVAIGRPNSPPGAVTFLAETVVKYEIVNPHRLCVIEVEGIVSTNLYAETQL